MEVILTIVSKLAYFTYLGDFLYRGYILYISYIPFTKYLVDISQVSFWAFSWLLFVLYVILIPHPQIA